MEAIQTMAKKLEQNLIVGLDIGTSKVVAIVGHVCSEGRLSLLGLGSYPSRGLKKGIVVNIDAVVYSIQKAIEEAEAMSGVHIQAVYTGISGSHIRSFNSHGIVAIRDNEVSSIDIERVIEAARAILIPSDQKILHVIPREYIIDNQEGIKEPLGMSGVRLETKVHMVTGSISAAQNIVKSVRRCGLEVEDIILQQIASSDAILTEDERQLGVCIVDIGAGTTDIAVFVNGAIIHTAVIPIAGDQVTNDIAVALRVSSQTAETIKMQSACALSKLVGKEDMIEISNVGERGIRRLSKQALAEVIEPRFEELFLMVQDELKRHNLDKLLGAGIVVTGGSSSMQGVVELVEEIFELPARLGIPMDIPGLNDVIKSPVYATGLGLILQGYHAQQGRGQELLSHQGFKGVWGRMKGWFQGNF
ncbi:MAG: cell division protein FtsA [Francisellaceae bacterium]|nr:cell division protein FtsA [Francisellaceae bacterium]